MKGKGKEKLLSLLLKECWECDYYNVSRLEEVYHISFFSPVLSDKDRFQSAASFYSHCYLFTQPLLRYKTAVLDYSCRVLEWGDGYYNGDVKTRKTGPDEDVNADKLGLRRSEQLKELYESLLEGESELEGGNNKRPSASLSPEDLSDLEWYYLVCMSFVFKSGQGLPGRAWASGQPIWLCNAQDADSKVFSRSLLAKSASIQTVICFPHAAGVVELGVTDAVSEDPNIIQHIKTSLLEFAKPICFEKPFTQGNTDSDNDHIGATITDIARETMETEAFTNFNPFTENVKFNEEVVHELHRTVSDEFKKNMVSPEDCSNACCANNHLTEDSFVQDENDDPSLCIHDSIDSSGCISQAFEIVEKPVCSPKGKNVNNRFYLQELEDFSSARFGSLDLGNNNEEDLHYKRTVAVILHSTNHTVKGQSFGPFNHKTSFVPWKREAGVGMCHTQSPQATLKKILFRVPLLISGSPLKAVKEKQKDREPLADNICTQKNLSKKSRENEKYMVLKSLIPSINKIDKTSILNNTIEYLKELEARVGELESCINLSDSEVRAKRKNMDMVEQTSDNYDHKSGKKLLASKRKASDIDEDESDPQLGNFIPIDNNIPSDVKVSFSENEVLIEMRCSWREYLLLDIMEAVNNLNLDAHTVQSSTLDGILTVSLRSKFRGVAFASAGMIKQALRRTAGIC